MSIIRKWQLLDSKDVSPSKWFPLAKNSYKLPNNTLVDDFYIARHSDVAMVVPVLSTGEIIFVRQYKPGVDEIVTELPAGMVKDSQTPHDAALAELKEETGGTGSELQLLGIVYNSPTKSSQKVHIYLALDVEITSAQELDETEEIEIVKVMPSQIEAKMEQGEINCSDTLAALTLVKLKRPDLFK